MGKDQNERSAMNRKRNNSERGKEKTSQIREKNVFYCVNLDSR